MATNIETQSVPGSLLPRESSPNGIDVFGVKSGRTVKTASDNFAFKSDLSNLVSGMLPQGSVTNVSDLPTTPFDATTDPNGVKTGYAYIVTNSKDPVSGLSYIYAAVIVTTAGVTTVQWNNTKLTAFPSDVLSQSDITQLITEDSSTIPANKAVFDALAVITGGSPKTILQVDEQSISRAFPIDVLKSDTITTQMLTGLKAFKTFRLVLFKGYENNEYFIYGLYNWAFSNGVPLFRVGKMVGATRTVVTPNTLLANAIDLKYIQSNTLHRVYLTDGAGYIEFSIDMALYGGYNPSPDITYLQENQNKKIYVKPFKVEVRTGLYTRAVLEYYRRYYYNYTGVRTTGDYAAQKSAIYPISGNINRLKITTMLSGDVPALVFFNAAMQFIEYYKDGSAYANKEVPLTPSMSKAAFVGINGQTGEEMSLWIENTESSEFALNQLDIPVSAYVDAAYMQNNGTVNSTDVADMCYLKLACKQSDVITISSKLVAAGASLAVYKDASGNVLDYEGGLTRTDHNFYNLTIPKDAVEVFLNGQKSNGRLKVFANGRLSDYLNTQLTDYNKQTIVRTVSSYYANNGILQTGDYAAQSATKKRTFAGEQFLISSTLTGSVSLIIVTDINGTVLELKESGNTGRTFKDYPYTAPANAFWIMVNGRTGYDLTIKRKGIVPVYNFPSEIDSLNLKVQSLWLFGKKILVVGNSIPAGGDYHEAAALAVNATLNNEALGASFIKRGEQNPTTPILADNTNRHRMSSLIETQAEKASIWSGLCTPEQLAWAKTTSYEIKVLPYLSGVNKVDLIIIEHGFNDRLALGTLTDLQNRNKDTFVGAMAALIDIIRNVDYRMRIMIQTHYDNTMTVFSAKEICEAQEMVADYMGVPVFKFYEKTGLSNQWVAGTSGLHPSFPRYGADPVTGDLTQIQCVMPDGYHPHSDPTGLTQKMMADVETIEYRVIR
ncbi:SGNH/GDSL hydrolase family protein [Dysgonomonas sp. GY617]|uniref:SGNH/GDSL hydrolase family protein n=1 Tax=Dysgonomonas sp. GY617 TaxID=2780420 RepID=UPI00188448CE|nr:SGNH/GDSL hydrolase family protein [Dysgonomonas sp. GY617]MBF0577743.1 SGNH/GDSL hydrolase family protein [Dysgonomonas sp. GY617]